MIPLTNHHLWWGRNEVVIISPEKSGFHHQKTWDVTFMEIWTEHERYGLKNNSEQNRILGSTDSKYETEPTNEDRSTKLFSRPDVQLSILIAKAWCPTNFQHMGLSENGVPQNPEVQNPFPKKNAKAYMLAIESFIV